MSMLVTVGESAIGMNIGKLHPSKSGPKDQLDYSKTKEAAYE